RGAGPRSSACGSSLPPWSLWPSLPCAPSLLGRALQRRRSNRCAHVRRRPLKLVMSLNRFDVRDRRRADAFTVRGGFETFYGAFREFKWGNGMRATHGEVPQHENHSQGESPCEDVASCRSVDGGRLGRGAFQGTAGTALAFPHQPWAGAVAGSRRRTSMIA